MALSFLFLLFRPPFIPHNSSFILALINRQLRIYFLRPRIDSALEVLHLFEPRTGQQLQCAGGAGAAFAEDNHIIGAVQLGEASGQLSQRNVEGIG